MKMHSLFGKLMQKSYVLFLFALLISLVIWVYMSLSAAPYTDTTRDIYDVPIQIEAADESGNGFQAFGIENDKATVTISGERTVLGKVSKSDLIATASMGTIDSAGNYTLPVIAKKTSNLGNFDVKSWTPTSINVFVDYLEEKEFDIEPDITFHTEEGFYGQVAISPQTVTVSGPRTEVQKIARVVVRAVIPETEKLKDNREVDTKLVLLDKDGNEVSQKLLHLSVTDVKASITVQPTKSVRVEPEFINKPAGIKITEDIVQVDPSELLLAGKADALNKVESVKLDTIDFAKLKNEQITINSNIIIPADCKSITNNTTADVEIDLSGFAEKEMVVEKFEIEGLSDKYNAVITTKSMKVTVYGSESDIKNLKSSQITAVVDASNSSGRTGSVQLPVSFRFTGADTCWAYSAEEANVIITKKE